MLQQCGGTSQLQPSLPLETGYCTSKHNTSWMFDEIHELNNYKLAIKINPFGVFVPPQHHQSLMVACFVHRFIGFPQFCYSLQVFDPFLFISLWINWQGISCSLLLRYICMETTWTLGHFDSDPWTLLSLIKTINCIGSNQSLMVNRIQNLVDGKVFTTVKFNRIAVKLHKIPDLIDEKEHKSKNQKLTGCRSKETSLRGLFQNALWSRELPAFNDFEA